MKITLQAIATRLRDYLTEEEKKFLAKCGKIMREYEKNKLAKKI